MVLVRVNFDIFETKINTEITHLDDSFEPSQLNLIHIEVTHLTQISQTSPK